MGGAVGGGGRVLGEPRRASLGLVRGRDVEVGALLLSEAELQVPHVARVCRPEARLQQGELRDEAAGLAAAHAAGGLLLNGG